MNDPNVPEPAPKIGTCGHPALFTWHYTGYTRVEKCLHCELESVRTLALGYREERNQVQRRLSPEPVAEGGNCRSCVGSQCTAGPLCVATSNPVAWSPGRQYAETYKYAVTDEWVRGFDACHFAYEVVDPEQPPLPADRPSPEPGELQQELADAESLRERMSDILRRTAVALHGGELENGYWSWHDLPELAAILRDGLQFYASENHFSKGDKSDWDTVSGEPANFWCDEHGNTIEDGSIAKMALALQPIIEEPELPLDDAQPETKRGV